MGILARSWNSNGTRPIPVHVAEFESQPVGQEENMSLITPHLRCGARWCPSGYTTQCIYQQTGGLRSIWCNFLELLFLSEIISTTFKSRGHGEIPNLGASVFISKQGKQHFFSLVSRKGCRKRRTPESISLLWAQEQWVSNLTVCHSHWKQFLKIQMLQNASRWSLVVIFWKVFK